MRETGRLVTATAAKSGQTVTALLNGVTTTINVARDLTVASGDVLIVVPVGSEWFAVGRGYAAAPTPVEENDTPPPPKPTLVTGTTSIAPVETRSYRSGKWRTDTDDVYQGAYGGNGNHTGCVFYGRKPRSLAGAEVLAASIRVRRPDAGGANAAQPTTMRLMTNATRPGGAPTLGASTSGPSLRRGTTDSSFAIPTSWGQALVDGSAGGLAFYESDGSPYVILAGRGTYGPAFTLALKWKR
jgi:hypothetical protein